MEFLKFNLGFLVFISGEPLVSALAIVGQLLAAGIEVLRVHTHIGAAPEIYGEVLH